MTARGLLGKALSWTRWGLGWLVGRGTCTATGPAHAAMQAAAGLSRSLVDHHTSLTNPSYELPPPRSLPFPNPQCFCGKWNPNARKCTGVRAHPSQDECCSTEYSPWDVPSGNPENNPANPTREVDPNKWYLDCDSTTTFKMTGKCTAPGKCQASCGGWSSSTLWLRLMGLLFSLHTLALLFL